MTNMDITVNNNVDIINKNDDISEEKPAYEIWYQSEQSKTAIEPIQPSITNIYEHLYQIPPTEGEQITLASLSDKDSIWDDKRRSTELVGDIYSYNSEFERYAERMTDCSTYLMYGFNDDGIKLKNANFCRIRHCPVCQWRRSLKWKSDMYVATATVLAEYPNYHFLFLTLTIKNPLIGDLRETINHMNKSWQRLIKRKEFMNGVVGWVRTTEVTRPSLPKKNKKDPTVFCPDTMNTHAHPHFHIVLMVKPSYFGKGYIKQQRWSDLWGESLRVDYQPIVHITKIKPKKNSDQTQQDALKSAIIETLKYSVKPADMIGDGSMKSNVWFYELTRQVYKLRFIATGGILKDALKSEDDITAEDMITPNDDDIGEVDDRRLMFTYTKAVQKYLYNSPV